jgi:hypothetical protein
MANPKPANHLNAKQAMSALALFAIGLGGWLFWEHLRTSWNDSSRAHDAEFCREQLGYYENFCKVYPANCAEGPRKLAKCDP